MFVQTVTTMGKIMTYKETAICPICGLLLEKQEKVIHLGIPAVKAECPDCGYIAYFFDWKTDSKMKESAAEHLHDDLSEARDVTADCVKAIKPDVTGPADESQYQRNDQRNHEAKDSVTYKVGKVFADFKFYPRFCRKFCRFFCHLL